MSMKNRHSSRYNNWRLFYIVKLLLFKTVAYWFGNGRVVFPKAVLGFVFRDDFLDPYSRHSRVIVFFYLDQEKSNEPSIWVYNRVALVVWGRLILAF